MQGIVRALSLPIKHMSEINLPWLDPFDEHAPFPSPESALDHPEGLVAAGGDLSPTRLLRAYYEGLFPWYEEDQPILWWSPNPRGVILPKEFIAHKSLIKSLKRKNCVITYDTAFKDVITACSQPRKTTRGTWITQDMIEAYVRLHQLNHAHSIEVWNSEKQLIGGVYGISIGSIFFGESMFSRETDASKIALLYLSAYLDTWKFDLIDTQLPSDHLTFLGGKEISRENYLSQLSNLTKKTPSPEAWKQGKIIDISEWLQSIKT